MTDPPSIFEIVGRAQAMVEPALAHQRLFDAVAAQQRVVDTVERQQQMLDTVERQQRMLDTVARQQRLIDATQRATINQAYAISDPLAPYRNTVVALRQLHEQRTAIAALSPLRQYEQIAKTFDALTGYRSVVERLNLATFRDLAKTFTPFPGDDDVLDLDALLNDEEGDATTPLVDWVARLSPSKRRAVFAISLHVLWTAVHLAASRADIEVSEDLAIFMDFMLSVVDALAIMAGDEKSDDA